MCTYVLTSWNSHSGIAAFSTWKEKLKHATSYHLDYPSAYYTCIIYTYYIHLLCILMYDCWLKKSCTTWDVKNLVNAGVNYLSAGAGFLPSTVSRTLKVCESREAYSFLWFKRFESLYLRLLACTLVQLSVSTKQNPRRATSQDILRLGSCEVGTLWLL